MSDRKKNTKKIIIAFLTIITILSYLDEQIFSFYENNFEIDNIATNNEIKNIKYEEPNFDNKIINKIIITGNNLISDEALLVRVPYRSGQNFNKNLTGQLIKNLYELSYFEYIEVQIENVSDKKINLHIIVKEKKKIESITFQGNKNLSEDEIEKKYKFSELKAINKEEAKLLAEQIKKLYQEKNYHDVKIDTKLKPTPNNNIETLFEITEGKRALVKKVEFIGNKSFSGKKLRSMIFTREDWLLGAMDKSGTYQPDALEYDKHVIENFYQSNGFLAARVKDVKVDIDPETQNISVQYTVEEGDLYTIKSISAQSNEILSEAQVLSMIPIKPGQLYNKDLIRQTIELLRTAWGQFGYIYADIEPIVLPDLKEKTVDITFNSDLGNKIYLNRINIIGNDRTRDYVIRRTIAFNEGELLTSNLMDYSKSRVESLGFFDPKDGVNWKINKVSEDLVDLDLILKEIKTGRFGGQLGFNGFDIKSPSNSLKVGISLNDANFMGTGINYNLSLSWAKEDRGIFFSVFQPWLFDYPIGGGLDAYHRKSIYEDFSNVVNTPVETVTGAVGQLRFIPLKFPDLPTVFNAGFEKIDYKNKVTASSFGKTKEESKLLQSIINQRFESGNFTWVGFATGQDMRNHPIYPSKGYNWNITGKFGIPTTSRNILDGEGNFGFYKIDLDATWLTPLIGDSDLIFLLHGHAGFVKPLNGRNIPYRELYHIGGPATVRGFNFGQIGPQVFGDSIGAQNAFWVNAELIFSVTADHSIRTVLFYDGGAAWDTPNTRTFTNLGLESLLKNNKFNYRHAVGFGIRITKPSPLKIDWGFKLDRNKRLGESISEVHFGMSQEF